jgi:hypothetical protein
MSRYTRPQELFIKFRDTDLVGNELNFDLHTDLYADRVTLVEYELGGLNVSGAAGVPVDKYIYVDVGDLRGGDETIQTTLEGVGCRAIPLSTNNVLSTGAQRLQTPVVVSTAARTRRRALTFRMFNDAGQPYAHAGGAGTFFIALRFIVYTHSADLLHRQGDLTTSAAGDYYAHAHN